MECCNIASFQLKCIMSKEICYMKQGNYQVKRRFFAIVSHTIVWGQIYINNKNL